MAEDKAPEPGWGPGSQQQEELPPRSPQTPTTSSEPDRPSQASPPASDLRKIPQSPSSFQGSSDSLAGLIGEGLQLFAALATALTKNRFNVDLKMQPREAQAAATPIARLIARRFQIRRDLAEATDATAAGASLMTYVERIASNVVMPPQIDRRVAQAPAQSAVPLADERYYEETAPRWEPPATPAAGRPEISDQYGNAIPGSGPFKGAFLSGFDE